MSDERAGAEYRADAIARQVERDQQLADRVRAQATRALVAAGACAAGASLCPTHPDTPAVQELARQLTACGTVLLEAAEALAQRKEGR